MARKDLSMITLQRSVGAAIALLAGTFGASAQVSMNVIAQTGRQVPGAPPGVVFARTFAPSISNPTTAFLDAAIDARGDTTIHSLTPTPPRNTSMFHRVVGGQLTPLWFNFQPDPLRASAETRMDYVVMLNEGAVMGYVNEGDASSPLRGFGIGEPFSVPLLTGEQVTGSTDTWRVNVNLDGPAFSANRAGEGVFFDYVSDQTSALKVLGYFAPGVPPRVLLRQGDFPPNPPANAGGQFSRISSPAFPAIGPDGTIVVGCAIGSQTWLYAGTAENLRPVLNGFEDVQGLPPNVHLTPTSFPTSGFDLRPSAAIAADGQFATIAQFFGSGFATQAALVAGDRSSARVILRDKSAVAGLPPGIVVRFGAFPAFVLAGNGGAVAFQSYSATPNATTLSNIAVFGGVPGDLRLIAQVGDPVPIGPDLTMGNMQLLGVNAPRDVLVQTYLAGTGATPATNRALLVYTLDSGIVPLARTGDPLTLGPADVRTISGFGGQEGFATQRNAQINDSRQVVASIAFTDGSEAVVRFQLPLPPCPADFNRRNGLEVQDIFAFLQAWFAAEPRADFDSSGILEAVDIFAFLQAWFAGCA
jgi:hypothetical protein